MNPEGLHWQSQIRADELTAKHLGTWVFIPGNRGVLRGTWVDEDGAVAVATSAGIAHYPPDTLVWTEVAS